MAEKTALNHRKLQLQGEPYIEGEWQRPNLVFDIYAGNPQIAVWSKHPDEEGKKIQKGFHKGRNVTDFPIKASTSWPRLRSVLIKLQGLIGQREPVSMTLTTLTVQRDPVTNEPVKGKRVPQARIVYGRSPEGYLFIEVRNPERPVLPFFFKEDGWHEEKVNNEEKDLATMSDDVAAGFLATVIDTYQQVFKDTYDPNFTPKYQAKKDSVDVKDDTASPKEATSGWSGDGW